MTRLPRCVASTSSRRSIVTFGSGPDSGRISALARAAPRASAATAASPATLVFLISLLSPARAAAGEKQRGQSPRERRAKLPPAGRLPGAALARAESAQAVRAVVGAAALDG